MTIEKRGKIIAAAFALSPTLMTAEVVMAQGVASSPQVASVRFELPQPGGKLTIGRVDLHLKDAGRADAFHPERRRELIVSIWYPAQTGTRAAPAPYMQPEAARLLAESLLKPLGRDPALIDFSAVETHAFADAPAASGTYPLILYTPGSGVTRSAGTIIIEDLVSRGYVVVAIDHTFESPAVTFPNGQTQFAVSLTGDGPSEKIIQTRVADARFVLDQLQIIHRGRNPDVERHALPRGLRQAIDFSRIGVFGHSAGGVAALELMSADQRVKAAANLDGSVRLGAGSVVDKGLDRPFLLMGAGVVGTQNTPHNHLGSPDWQRLWDHSTGWKRDIYVAAGRHMAFADHLVLIPQIGTQLKLPLPLVSGAIGTGLPASLLDGQRAYLGAFFDLHLKGRAVDFEKLAEAHPEFVNAGQ